MNSRTKVRTVRGWDIGLAAAILAVMLLGWLTAPGGNGAVAHSGQSAAARSGQGAPAMAKRRGHDPLAQMKGIPR